ncbi:MAG: aldo/keto reductase [Spirochaetaceae bacterium]|jgi:predicted aldo/keto reductase-like oxidoreductase|nr:aldo/keto reductase [Spirochaetaceae bacterium]
MQYRNDKYGNKLSILGFGCMRFPQTLGKIDIKKTRELVALAIDKGINYFDTAWLYPGIEEALGTVLRELGKRKEIYIASKMPVMMCAKQKDLDKYFSVSLERLKTEYIDYYLMHSLSDFAAWQKMRNLGAVEWIERQKKSGAIKQIGFSFHGSRVEFLKILNDYDWDFCLIQYNYSDENYQAGKAGLKAAHEKGIPVIIMEPLLGGKLVNQLPKTALEAFKRDNPSLSPAARGFLWLWNQSEVTVVLSGMNAVSQLQENAALTDSAYPGCLSNLGIYQTVRDEFKKSYKIHCTGCNYCQPCPKQINIPGCFSAYNVSYMMGLIEGIKQYVLSTGSHSPKPHGASNCIKCGKCEPHCPQNIPIRAELERVKKRLEPFYFRAAIRAIKTFWFKGQSGDSDNG